MKVRTMNGELIDMGALRGAHDNAVAIGNARLNARGDAVDRNGVVLKTSEELAEEYNRNNPCAVKSGNISLRSIEDEVMTPAEMVAKVEEMGKPMLDKGVKKRIKFDD